MMIKHRTTCIQEKNVPLEIINKARLFDLNHRQQANKNHPIYVIFNFVFSSSWSFNSINQIF